MERLPEVLVTLAKEIFFVRDQSYAKHGDISSAPRAHPLYGFVGAVIDNGEQNLNRSRIRYIYLNEIQKTDYERYESISSVIYGLNIGFIPEKSIRYS